MAEINVTLSQIQSQNVDTVKYNADDVNLLGGNLILRQFGLSNDYVEQVLYDIAGNLIDINYNYVNQQIQQTLVSPENTTSEVVINPESDLQQLGYTSGEFKLLYNFFRKKIGNGNANPFYIKEISSDRTEIRVASNTISNSDLQIQVQSLINEIQSTAYYKDYLLNFGDNNLFIAVNVALEQTTPQYSVLFKLYEPLPPTIQVKNQFWVVEKVADPVEYTLTATRTITPPSIPQLRAPNFDLDVNNQINKPGPYENINSLLADTSTPFYQKLSGLLEQKSIQINVDYNNYENFVHFSSAKERLLNFVYKAKLIEGYQNEITTLNSVPGSSTIVAVSGNIANVQSKIDDIITKFDGYERFLYFTSGSVSGSNSYPWPKQNSSEPYALYSVTSSQAIAYLGSDNSFASNYGGQILSASLYDQENQNNLVYTIPEFIRENEDNVNYEIFLNMIGQHFDNVWTYSRAMTDLYDARNKLTEGISKDLVFYALKSLGVKLYTNERSSENVFDYLLGFNPTIDIPNPLTTTYTLPAGGTFYVNSLTITSTGHLIIPSTTTLNVNGTLTNNGTITNNNIVNTVTFNNFGTTINNTINTVAQTYMTNLISYADITGEDYDKEVFKRIYHNLPLLYKAKGTEPGLRALINCYGIPDTILRISETGGADKSAASIEYDHNRFTYGFRTSGSINDIDTGAGNIHVRWAELNQNFSNDIPSIISTNYTLPENETLFVGDLYISPTGILNIPVSTTLYANSTTNDGIINGSISSGFDQVPQTVELRFKPDQLNVTSSYVQSLFEVGLSTQILFQYDFENPLSSVSWKVELEKDPSVHTGLMKDYGYLRFVINDGTNMVSSSNIELPFFNGSYYNMMLTQTPDNQVTSPILSNAQDTTFTLYAKSNVGEYIDNQEGEYIGHQGSASLFFPSSSGLAWFAYNVTDLFGQEHALILGGSGPGSITNSNNNYFKGTFQELRYWGKALEESTFDFHVLNPESYEGNTTGSSYQHLALRLPLGNDLKTTDISGDYITSTHPGSTPNFITSLTASFANPTFTSSSYISGTLSQSFEPFTEQYYYNSPNTGILERVTNKIRIISSSIPDNVLSPIARIEEISDADLTQDIHLIEIAFSPQNEINDDIISQLGFFNIDDYIGDPQEDILDQYPDLEALKEYYFQKYITNYNVFDYIRLIKYFDNSLFKMIKDYIPARANASTGIVIKPHILERNKQPRLPLEVEQPEYSGSIPIVETDGDSGGVYESAFRFFTSSLGVPFNNYSASIQGNLGIVNQVGTFNEEFYTGEIGGSVIRSINGPNNPFAKPNYS
jgi:hypothetical protein